MRKNILILGHNDSTQFIDVYNQYVRLFDPSHYAVTIAYLKGKPTEETKQRTLAENVIFLDSAKGSLRALKIKAIQKLLRLCKQEKFQLVICHRYKPTYIMLWAAQFCPIPAIIFVMHELKTMAAIHRQILVRCLTRHNMIFAGVSNAVRDDMRNKLSFLPKERIVTLYNAIDVLQTEPLFFTRTAAREALNFTANDFIFGHVARLARNKDQASLIQAFALIKPYCPRAKLLMMGEGSLVSELQQQVQQLELTANIIFTGFVPGAFRYMPAFDCFVLSSIQEAFGRVLIEAMLAKIPIIATSVNGIPEIITHSAGTLVKASDPANLAAAMQKIYHVSQQERLQQGEQNYQHVISQFSISAFFQQFWRLPLIQALKS